MDHHHEQDRGGQHHPDRHLDAPSVHAIGRLGHAPGQRGPQAGGAAAHPRRRADLPRAQPLPGHHHPGAAGRGGPVHRHLLQLLPVQGAPVRGAGRGGAPRRRVPRRWPTAGGPGPTAGTPCRSATPCCGSCRTSCWPTPPARWPWPASGPGCTIDPEAAEAVSPAQPLRDRHASPRWWPNRWRTGFLRADLDAEALVELVDLVWDGLGRRRGGRRLPDQLRPGGPGPGPAPVGRHRLAGPAQRGAERLTLVMSEVPWGRGGCLAAPCSSVPDAWRALRRRGA